ncbi:MAG: YerC/YecD family TrpR-related protein [Parcubacteria group bacterium]
MSRYVHKKMSYEKQDEYLREFCEVLQELDTVQEKMNFLKDLLNRGERIMLIRRFKIAFMLVMEKTYDDIIKALRTGRGTIAKVERLVNFGRGGYRNAIKKIASRNKR